MNSSTSTWYSVISRVSSPAEIKRAIDRLTDRHGRTDWYRFDRAGVDSEDGWYSFTYYRRVLPSLRAFAICDTNELINVIKAHHASPFDDDKFSSFWRFIVDQRGNFQKAHISCESAGAYSRRSSNGLSLLAAWDDRFWSVAFILSPLPPKYRDVSERRRYFQEVVTVMGLNRYIEFHDHPQGFVMQPIGSIQLSFPRAGLSGENPAAFRVKGLPSPDDVVSAIGSLRSSGLVPIITEMELYLSIPESHYGRIAPAANDLASPWQIDFHGRYADGVDPYQPGPHDDAFPLCAWWTSERKTAYECDAVYSPHGPRLKIFSDCGSIVELMRIAEEGTGLQFEPATA